MMRHGSVAMLLVIAGSAVAVPHHRTLTENFGPNPPRIENGLPVCDLVTGPEAPEGTENQLDAFQGLGMCQALISQGQMTCENDFCRYCSNAEYCDGLCGFCTHDDAFENPEPWEPGTVDPVVDGCADDETARAAAGITQSCEEVAEAGLCMDLESTGILDFCCQACQTIEESHPEYACDEPAIIAACENTEAIAGMQGSSLDVVCGTECATTIEAQYDACSAKEGSIVAQNRDVYALIVTECQELQTAGDLDRGGH